MAAAAGSSFIVFVKNLAYDLAGPELWELFGGTEVNAVRKIKLGINNMKGTAYIVFHNAQGVSLSLEVLHQRSQAETNTRPKMQSKGLMDSI